MITKQEQWRSPSLGKDMTIKIYGNAGTPVIGLPTRGQHSGQWQEFGMTEAVAPQLNNGYNQLFCLDSVDEESFLNKKMTPAKRLMRHLQYESYILEEVIPFVNQQNSRDYLMIAGVDLGAYHAVNIALKHPRKFNKVIGISGLYDIKSFFDDFYDDTLYFNNPIDFVPNLNKQPLLDDLRDVDFRLVSYANDARKNDALTMGGSFRKKFMEYQLDIWDIASDKEWDVWRQMLKTHII